VASHSTTHKADAMHRYLMALVMQMRSIDVYYEWQKGQEIRILFRRSL
jgi:hypothetical protein